MKLIYTSQAKEDIELAFVWYERQRRGLGFDFLDCMESSVHLILETPDLYKFIELDNHLKFQVCIIRRFPFSIFYTVEGKKIIIHSVFDNRQNPDKYPE